MKLRLYISISWLFMLFLGIDYKLFYVDSSKDTFIYKYEMGFCEPLTTRVLTGVLRGSAGALTGSNSFNTNLNKSKVKISKELRFDLYTRKNPYEKQILLTGDRNALFNSNFNVSWPVRFSIHGWNGKTSTCSNAAIKDAYIAHGNFNVILVDWSDYALDINYIRVILETREIAEKINQFTHFLHYWTRIPFSDMYLAGHSVGCHIAGIAGKLLKPERYGVIYALDPSGPIHALLNENWRLTPNDAIYVESIHTDIKLFGFPSDQLGHASFYINWGLGQPHCPNVTRTEPYYSCDHFSSLYYFVESIYNSQAFGGIRCKNFKSILHQTCTCSKNDNKLCRSQTFMGGEPAINKSGLFYVSTRSNRPFGYGKIVRIQNALKSTVLRASRELSNEILQAFTSPQL